MIQNIEISLAQIATIDNDILDTFALIQEDYNEGLRY